MRRERQRERGREGRTEERSEMRSRRGGIGNVPCYEVSDDL